jgi:hypothetical protein
VTAGFGGIINYDATSEGSKLFTFSSGSYKETANSFMAKAIKNKR